MEKDDEIKGEANSLDFGARMYDPRVGRWFAPDKMEKKYPGFSTYNYALNNPIIFIDPDGNDIGGPKIKAILVNFTFEQLTVAADKLNFKSLERKSIQKTKNGKIVEGTYKPSITISTYGLSMIALYEELSLTVYDMDGDPNGNATIGFGHLLYTGVIKDNDAKLKISFDQAVNYLAEDIIEAENVVNQKIENKGLKGKINRNQFFALVDIQFNSGDAFIGDVLDKLIENDYLGAAEIIRNNNKIDGKVNDGITKRRIFEAEAFECGNFLTPEQAAKQTPKKTETKSKTKNKKENDKKRK